MKKAVLFLALVTIIGAGVFLFVLRRPEPVAVSAPHIEPTAVAAQPAAKPTTIESAPAPEPTEAPAEQIPPVADAPEPTPALVELAPGESTVSGMVVRWDSGVGVVGATVNLYALIPGTTQPANRKTTTDALGRYSFDKLPATTVAVLAETDELMMLREPGSQAPTAVDGTQMLEMDPIKLYPGHIVEGVVRDAATHEPIAGARISVTQMMDKKDAQVTGKDGHFEFSKLSGIAVRFTIESEGYVLAGTGNTVTTYENGVSKTILPTDLVSLTPDVLIVEHDFELSPALYVAGTLNYWDGRVASGAKVRFSEMRNYSGREDFKMANADGTFRLSVLEGQIGNVIARSSEGLLGVSDLVTVRAGGVDNVKVVFKQGASISGRIIGPDGAIVSDGSVQVYQEIERGNYSSYDDVGVFKANEEGFYTAANLPADTALHLFPQSQTYNRAQMTDLTLALGEKRTNVDLQVETGAIFSGVVLTSERKPIASAMVTISSIGEPRRFGTSTNEKGEFSMANAPPGELKVWVRSMNSMDEKEFTGYKGGDENVELIFEAKVFRIIGKVIDGKSRKPVARYNARRTGSIDELARDDQNRFVLKMENRYESYDVTIEAAGYAPLTQQYRITEEEGEREVICEMYPPGGIVGRIVSEVDNKPVAQARIELHGANFTLNAGAKPVAETTTDAEGRFRFDSAQKGRNTLNILPPKPYVDRREYVTVEEGKTTDAGNISVGSGGVLRVTLMQAETRNPIPGELITLSGGGRSRGYSSTGIADANGVYTFNNLPTNWYTASALGSSVHIAELSPGQTREVVLAVGTGRISGVVYRGDKPANGTYIQAEGAFEGTPDQRFIQINTGGKYEISNLAPGQWRFYQDQTELGVVDLAPGASITHDVHFPSGKVTGHVIDAEEKFVEGADIISITGEPTKTDAGGAFVLSGLPQGEVVIVARKDDASGSEKVTLDSADAEKDVLIRIQPDGPKGTLESVALRINDGQPIPSAWLRIRNEDGAMIGGRTTRDAHGMVQVELAPGVYTTEVSDWGHSEARHTVEIRSGETATIEDVLYEAGSMAWTIVAATGAPIANAGVTLTPLDPSSIEDTRTGTTNAIGHWEDRGLQPGDYRAAASLANGGQITEIFTIKAHEHTEHSTREGS